MTSLLLIGSLLLLLLVVVLLLVAVRVRRRPASAEMIQTTSTCPLVRSFVCYCVLAAVLSYDVWSVQRTRVDDVNANVRQ